MSTLRLSKAVDYFHRAIKSIPKDYNGTVGEVRNVGKNIRAKLSQDEGRIKIWCEGGGIPILVVPREEVIANPVLIREALKQEQYNGFNSNTYARTRNNPFEYYKVQLQYIAKGISNDDELKEHITATAELGRKAGVHPGQINSDINAALKKCYKKEYETCLGYFRQVMYVPWEACEASENDALIRRYGEKLGIVPEQVQKDITSARLEGMQNDENPRLPFWFQLEVTRMKKEGLV